MLGNIFRNNIQTVGEGMGNNVGDGSVDMMVFDNNKVNVGNALGLYDGFQRDQIFTRNAMQSSQAPGFYFNASLLPALRGKTWTQPGAAYSQ